MILLLLLLFSSAFAVYAADDKQDAVPRFEIKQFRVEGNTLLDAARMEKLLAPFTGKDRDFGTVQEAIDALENAYRRLGYSTVAVALPEQEMESGIVRVKVTENRIGKLTIKGNRYFDEANIRRSLPALRQGETPNLNDLSRSLKQANENPAKKINLQLLNSDKENEVDANIEVKDERPWKAGITFDNTGTSDTGRTRVGALLQHANLLNRDHLVTLQYITAPEKLDKVNIYSAGYQIPFYSLGSSLQMIGAYSNVDSGTISAAGADMNVSGKGTILGIHYNQNLTRIGNYEHKVILSIDYRAYENNVNILGVQIGNNVTVHPVSISYAGMFSMENINAGFYLTGLHNIPGYWDGRDSDVDFEAARTGSSGSYNILRYGANAAYSFGGDWQVRALINGQFTNDRLVPGEQYGIGGATSVRGFQERQFSNDEGYSGSLELYSPDISKLFGVTDFQSRLLAFYDRGYVSRKTYLPGETSVQIAGIGPGLRITDGKRFSLSTDLGFVVDPDENTTRWSAAWHIALNILF
jgi:hemolysin activation/secretion protein